MAKVVKSDPNPVDDYARMNAAVGDAVTALDDPPVTASGPTPASMVNPDLPAETPTDEFELTAPPPVVVTDDIGEAMRHADASGRVVMVPPATAHTLLLCEIEAVLAEIVGGELIVPWAYDVREAAKGVLAKLRAGTPIAG